MRLIPRALPPVLALPRPPRSPPAAGRHDRRRLRRHPLGRDAQRHGRPQRRGHELPLRVRHDDGVRPHLRRRRRRRGRRPGGRLGAGLGPQRGHDLPLPARRLQRRRRRRRAPTARSARPPARALPGHLLHGRARGRADQRLAAQPHRPQPRRDDLPLRVRPLASPTARARRSATRAPATARVARRRDDRRPAAVPPLPLPRRGDQRGRPQRASRNRTLHHEPPADGDHALARRAAHRLGRRDRGLRPRQRRAASTGSRSRSSARTSRSPARSPRSACRRRSARTATGRFRFYVPTLFSATRLRALTRTTVQAISAPVTAQRRRAGRGAAAARDAPRRADPRLGRAGRAERARGAAAPDAPRRAGRSCAGRTRAPPASNRSRYGFKVRKRRAAQTYRVRVIARDGGAHVPGTSRSVAVRALKQRR